jgi:malonate-semialdehyde dehydrogenase (acetylating)/methylmalonate-semialdehyde dehydrogenase
VSAARRSIPGLARHAAHRPQPDLLRLPLDLVYKHREELAALITRDHGKTFPDALGEVMRGLETVEFACGLPVNLAGMNTPNVSTKVDAHTLRQPLGVAAGSRRSTSR